MFLGTWLLLMIGATGCGPSVVGRWTGALAAVTACADNSGAVATNSTTWIIEPTSRSGKLTARTTGLCSTIGLTEYGDDYAQVDAGTCPDIQVDGTLLSPQLTAGELHLVNGARPYLTAAVQLSLDIPPRGSCLAHYIGDLLLE